MYPTVLKDKLIYLMPFPIKIWTKSSSTSEIRTNVNLILSRSSQNFSIIIVLIVLYEWTNQTKSYQIAQYHSEYW